MSISDYIFSLFGIVFLVSTVPYVIISFTRVHQKDSCSTPSSCGNLPNISSPFRLEGDDHRHCYERHHKLVCKENHTILYLYNGRYYVEAISYDKQTITIKDSGLVMKTNSTTPSLPLYSLTRSNFSYDDPYDFVSNPPPTSKKDHRDDFMVVPIAFVTCPFGMIKSTSNSSQDLYYMDVTISNTSSNNIGNTSTYVVPGTMRLGDLEDSCVIGTRLDVVVTRNIFSEFCYADGLCRERLLDRVLFNPVWLKQFGPATTG
ncbi:hypothetical protein Syun_019513 [Stephania yunnanensis]|uniref:Wall-associated receptor kinase galacturonan-binding domain-containing protein n=1 Tax=Stephania yunnanensis TaxID=152371 RepID=A0AAP0IU94_9MAGN